MPKLVCKCGNVIDLTSVPCPSESLLVRDRILEDLAGQSFGGDEFSRWLEDRATRVYGCERCRRLIVFWRTGEPTYYTRD